MTKWDEQQVADSCDSVDPLVMMIDVDDLERIERRGPWNTRTARIRRTRCGAVEKNQELKAVFDGLAKTWLKETWFKSSIKQRIAHPAYLKIIGLGTPAVPWILEELRTTPDHWFWALESITRVDPAPEAKSMEDLRDAWLNWGRQHGHIA